MQAVSEEERSKGLRARSILLGVLLIPFVVLWVAAMEEVYGGRPTYLSFFFHAVILLAFLFGLNRLVSKFAPSVAFTRAELLVVYIMLCVSSGMVGDQFMAILIPSLANPFRYANEANQWVSELVPHLPSHAVMSDPGAVERFYEGDSTLYLPSNYGPWLLPGLLWSGFITVTQLMCLGINVLVRRQWTQHEKLSFPLVVLPIEMTAGGRGSIWSDGLTWAGFAGSALINIVNGLSMYFPALPRIPVKRKWMRFSRRWNAALTSTAIAFYPFIIGIAYLLPSDLTFSTWFFTLLFRFQRLVFSALGYPSPYPWQSFGQSEFPCMLEQGIGAYLAVVVFSLWAARGHLASVWQGIKEGAVRTGDARTEITPIQATEYRIAAITIIGGLFLTTWFATTLGMPASIGFAYIVLYLIINTAITKIRAEAGAPTHGFHFAGPDHILLTVRGPNAMEKPEMTAWGLFFGFNRGYPGVPMPHQLEGMKIGEMFDIDRQSLSGTMAGATTLGTFAGLWALLHLCFREGVEQMRSPVNRLSRGGWKLVDTFMNNPRGANWKGLIGIGIGFAFSTFLMSMRYRFVWWQFHPIGYAIAADWTTGVIWMPLMIGWFIKVMVMRYAGPKSYRRGISFFLGVILGEFSLGAFWSILAMVTRKPQYFFWE